MKYRLEFILFQFIKWIVLLLPLKSAQRLGYYLGSISYHFVTRRRNITLENLRHAFPEKPETEIHKIAKGAFQNYGIAITELLWFPNLNDARIRKLITIKNMQLITDEIKRGKGMIMLAGHFGNWELIALGAAYITGLQFTIIVQTQNNIQVDNVINSHRCLFGNRVVPMGISVREIIKTLDQGGVVAIAPDQSGPVDGVYINFFGRTVTTHQGPAVFALRSGASILMGFIIRKQDWTYEVIVEKIPSSDIDGSKEEKIIELTRRHTEMLEKYIRLYPHQWLWMHRRWKNVLKNNVQQQKAVSEQSD
jgi:KDO2-lipid IV(A) lauroyltransferase